jgi:hypothetical protein
MATAVVHLVAAGRFACIAFPLLIALALASLAVANAMACIARGIVTAQTRAHELSAIITFVVVVARANADFDIAFAITCAGLPIPGGTHGGLAAFPSPAFVTTAASGIIPRQLGTNAKAVARATVHARPKLARVALESNPAPATLSRAFTILMAPLRAATGHLVTRLASANTVGATRSVV